MYIADDGNIDYGIEFQAAIAKIGNFSQIMVDFATFANAKFGNFYTA